MILRSGMWVHDGQQVGILFQIGVVETAGRETRFDQDLGVVHFVAADGTTSEQVTLPLARLRRARIAEIPVARLQGVAPATLARLGYA